MSKVDITETCWLWTGPFIGQGYGRFWLNGKNHRAHRLMLEEKLGRPIADGMVAAHAPIICHNRSCINPEHLREATLSDNQSDRVLDNTHQSNVTLSESDVPLIRDDTRSLTKIAEDYGVTYNAIFKIKHRQTWKHII